MVSYYSFVTSIHTIRHIVIDVYLFSTSKLTDWVLSGGGVTQLVSRLEGTAGLILESETKKKKTFLEVVIDTP